MSSAHERILKSSVQEWNNYVQEQKDQDPRWRASLQGADLRDENLRGANLTGANLRGANLALADLTGADLALADLTGADLQNAGLRGAGLSGADLTSTDLARAKLTDADLRGAKLRGATLDLADLSSADLTYAKLTDANLRGADLQNTGLSGADLTDANLALADLTRAKLTRAKLTDAKLTKANLTDAKLTSADLTDANLRGAKLTNADLTDAKLTNAKLTGADLTSASLVSETLALANLRGANLRGANLRGANLRGAKLDGADLIRADLTRADLTSASLSFASLNYANLTSANLTQVDFSGVDLTRAKLTDANLTDALHLNHEIVESTLSLHKRRDGRGDGGHAEEATSSLRIVLTIDAQSGMATSEFSALASGLDALMLVSRRINSKPTGGAADGGVAVAVDSPPEDWKIAYFQYGSPWQVILDYVNSPGVITGAAVAVGAGVTAGTRFTVRDLLKGDESRLINLFCLLGRPVERQEFLERRRLKAQNRTLEEKLKGVDLAESIRLASLSADDLNQRFEEAGLDIELDQEKSHILDNAHLMCRQGMHVDIYAPSDDEDPSRIN